jgi:hypothetical protein
MRITALVCAACALALGVSEAVFALDAAAQTTPAGMGGTPLGGASTADMKPAADPPLAAPERDPAERSAKSIACAQKADAQGLQGKMRKHFLHECRSGV